MTVLWWILGILAVLVFLLALLCLMWVGVRVSLTPDSQVVDVKVGPIRFRIHPAKKKEKSGSTRSSWKPATRWRSAAEKVSAVWNGLLSSLLLPAGL